jgi:hypothetical protein
MEITFPRVEGFRVDLPSENLKAAFDENSRLVLTPKEVGPCEVLLVCYALESRSHWFVLLFAVSCALGSDYGFLQGAWPFGLVEAIWSAVALRRWLTARKC